MYKAKSKCHNCNVYVLEAVSDEFSGLAVNKRSIFLRWNNFIAGRPKSALLFWFFGGFRCGVPLFIVMQVIY